MKIYKIRDPKTGLFSTGGTNPKWEITGKGWHRINHVRSHLTQGESDSRVRDFYFDCELAEIVEIRVTHEVVQSMGKASDYIKGKLLERQIASEKYEKLYDEREYQEAKRIVEKYELKTD